MTPPALAATIMEGTPVTTMPVATLASGLACRQARWFRRGIRVGGAPQARATGCIEGRFRQGVNLHELQVGRLSGCS
jgi:hypothetical protein